ncbi:MAG: hypothetical protein ACFFCI_05845 [Promethearchaeota archaeon]
MANTEVQLIEPESDKHIIKEEIKFQYFWYLFIFFTIFLASFLAPAFLFMAYTIWFFLPYFLETTSVVSLFTEFKPLLALLSMPLVIIGCYLIRLFFISLITRWFWSLTEKKSPSKQGIIPRNFTSRTLNYYHIRGFLIKYPRNFIVKGLFPWLLTWFYNFVKSSKIGKGTTMEESPGGDKFIEVGKNCYIGVNSLLSSHMVDGVFGNINYFKIKVGDNVTASAKNLIAPGTEIDDNSYLLPLASAGKHFKLRGKGYYFSEGAKPLRKLFKRKIRNYLKINPKTLKPIPEKDNSYSQINTENLMEDEEKDYTLNFTTSSAISRVNIKFLIVYIPIFWLSGMLVSIMFYAFTSLIRMWLLMAFFLPLMVILMWLVFILGCLIFTKLFLILANLIHKPKEGVFKAEKPNKDFEFWMLRTELKKIVFWLIRNWPIPWMDILAFKFFGIRMSISSSIYDSWVDGEFIQFGRKNLLGQGSNIMSSMVAGKYLIIKKVILGDYVVIGGEASIAPGTIVGKESLVGAMSNTVYNHNLDPGWVYVGIPVEKWKPNKYAELRSNIIVIKDVDGEKKYEVKREVNF